ncbi:DUF4145 domain-containing protein [Pimelobacter simplex]|nr:DUF4145 domain-containing protein [Pimelobacter simplex]
MKEETETWTVQAAFACDHCGYLQIARSEAEQNVQKDAGHANAEMGKFPDWEWWPQVGVSREFEDVPSHISDAASEAHRCFSIQAYRGATALARAVIEASAKEVGITKGVLHKKIEDMEKAGHVRAHIREAAHEVRHLGNEVAHGDFVEPVAKDEAEEALALMAEVLQEVFQSPARVRRVRDKREAKAAARAT